MNHLLEIIRTKCIPERNCLLSIVNVKGDAAFLYFKEGELIEANHGAVWGQQAFNEVFSWYIAQYSLGELPVGIKRELWESIDALAQQALQVAHAVNVPSGEGVVDFVQSVAGLPGFVALYRLPHQQEAKLVYGSTLSELPSSPWLQGLIEKTEELGRTLGGERFLQGRFHVDGFYVWVHKYEDEKLIVFAQKNIDLDEFERQLQTLLTSLVP